jgi:lipoprotein-anchoring transpeptidase ErfK/SrfK
MKYISINQKKKRSLAYQNFTAFIMSGLVLCLFLLSACTSTNVGNADNSKNQAIPTPTVDPTLKNQGDAQAQTFQQWISLMQQYGGNSTSFQQQYVADQQALNNAHTDAEYKTALAVLNKHVEAIQLPAMKTEAQNLQQQLQQQVTTWGQTHKYYNSYNNTTYPLGYEYGANGIGGWVADEIHSSQTMADYQQAIEDINMYLTNFQAMTTNTADTIPYNQQHKTDIQLMQHFNKMNNKVVIVSLEEQAVRVYDQGKLVNAFLATTGRPDRPSIPGIWWIEGKQSPTVFKAGVPQSSPYWYPDTPINYAMQYHSQGYFIHDSWWRADYGPGTNFPHADSSGDSFSSQGSHGCVNLSKDNAAWLYGFVKLYTSIIIY